MKPYKREVRILRMRNATSTSSQMSVVALRGNYLHPGVLAFGYVKITIPPSDCPYSVFSVTILPSCVVTSMLPIPLLKSTVSPTASSLLDVDAGRHCLSPKMPGLLFSVCSVDSDDFSSNFVS